MKITINLSKKQIEHIFPYHTFYDCCGEVEDIMVQIQKEIKRNK